MHYSINIINASGKLVKTILDIPSGKLRFNKENLISGTYVLKLYGDGKAIASSKMMIY